MSRGPWRKKQPHPVYLTAALGDAVNEYLMSIAMLSPDTQRWYEQKLRHFEDWASAQQVKSVSELDAPLLRRYFAALSGEGTGLVPTNRRGLDVQPALSSRTLHGYYQTLKTFTRWLAQEELVEVQPFERIKAPKVHQETIKTFSAEQLKHMLVAAKRTQFPLRNASILTTLVDTGIRAGELCRLRIEDISLARNDALLHIDGKGRRERVVPLSPEARLPLYRYLVRERPVLEGEQHVKTVTSAYLGYGGRAMTPESLYALIRQLGDEAHVEGVRCSPHTLRHTFALNYLRAGGDVYHLSRLLGHGDVKTTEIYLGAFKQEDARAQGISVAGAVLGKVR